MSNDITVRPATADDLDAIARIKTIAFGGNETERREMLTTHSRYTYRDMVVGEVDGKLVGTATVFSTQMWLSGVPLPMGAVAGVATLPEFRNRGVASAMMQVLLEKMAQNNQAISILFPAVHGLYQRCGYAQCAVWHTYNIKPSNIPTFAEADSVRPFNISDLPAVKSLYRGSQLSLADGRLTRSNSWWEELTAENQRSGSNYIVVYEGDVGVEGYLKYRQADDNKLGIAEMFVATDAAYRGLWGFLAQQPNITSIDYKAAADDPIHHLFKIPIDSREGNRGWIFNDLYHATSTVMIRVIDVAEALTTRFYPHNMMGHRIMKITDPQLPQNEALINFRIVDGRPDILPANGEAPQFETDIATFSQIFCGFLTSEMARRLGKLQADDETVAWFDQAMVTAPLFMHSGDWF